MTAGLIMIVLFVLVPLLLFAPESKAEVIPPMQSTNVYCSSWADRQVRWHWLRDSQGGVMKVLGFWNTVNICLHKYWMQYFHPALKPNS